MRFEVGDRVRVRQWGDMVDEYGTNSLGSISISQSFHSPHFTPEMIPLCGLSGTVIGAGYDKYGDGIDKVLVQFDLDDGRSNIDFVWNYCNFMFESEYKTETNDALLEFIMDM